MTLFALAMISFVTERRGETRGSCRCLGTGPRNYGYDRIIIYGFAHEGVAVERKRAPSRADRDRCYYRPNRQTLLSPVPRFAKRSSPPRGRKLKISRRDRKRRAFEKRKGKRKGKSRLITGVGRADNRPRQKRNRASPTVITKRTTVEHN